MTTQLDPAFMALDVPVGMDVLVRDLQGSMNTLEGQIEEHGVLSTTGLQEILYV